MKSKLICFSHLFKFEIRPVYNPAFGSNDVFFNFLLPFQGTYRLSVKSTIWRDTMLLKIPLKPTS